MHLTYSRTLEFYPTSSFSQLPVREPSTNVCGFLGGRTQIKRRSLRDITSRESPWELPATYLINTDAGTPTLRWRHVISNSSDASTLGDSSCSPKKNLIHLHCIDRRGPIFHPTTGQRRIGGRSRAPHADEAITPAAEPSSVPSLPLSATTARRMLRG